MGRIKPSDFLRKNWLLIGILSSIFLAGIYPKLGMKGGPLKPEFTVKYLAVTTIFFLSGLSLKTENFLTALTQFKIHSFIQFFTFLFIPSSMLIFVRFMRFFNVDDWILKGLITVSCMPPPVSSAVILTRSARGNEAAAIFNSILGSFLGVLITPIILLFALGYTAIVPTFGIITELSIAVLLPIISGQFVRKYTSFRGYNLPLNAVGQIALLFIVYCSFCDTFSTPELGISASDVLITVFLVILIQMCFMYISFYFAKSLRGYFRPADVVAITFCSTHKSLTLGIPILRVMFHGYSHLSLISLPLLVYHPTQIILGGMAVTQMKDWVEKHLNKRPPV